MGLSNASVGYLNYPTQVCGALVAVTVTTLRKALTIVLSFILFSKPFTVDYVWAGLIILLAIYLNLYRYVTVWVTSKFRGIDATSSKNNKNGMLK
ncbi:hypothetical protein ANCCEY_10795 [Ancylostoma ceylanicum]|uniref:Adenosine 3'-phospho 5'-phosphosulfate transporter 2 n=1 Tax=Ancylostoma ceylanicum TaxID=53326 RepID=A0A0D6LG06_9BILA|nr:hypothetical protein ANCCEY_10795 [Ancylostoma ceylanicum]